MNDKHIEFARQDGVELQQDIADDFLRTILSLDPAEVFISDESQLADFVGAGEAPDEVLHAASLAAVHDGWDAWVRARIEARYHVAVTDTRILLTDLFATIETARQRPLN